MRWPSAGLVALALVGGVTVGCDHAPSPREVGTYVALGDSYTAGAGTGTNLPGPAGVCGQVPRNYPRLVAKELGAELTDASCGGARTGNAVEPQYIGGEADWPAQLDALDRETDLVTVSLGYNDRTFFFDAVYDCATLAPQDPTGSPCRDQREQGGVDPDALPDRIGTDLAEVVEQVRDRAPDAEVMVVGYPQPIPAEGTCPELPLATGDYAYARDQLARLDDAMRRAAEETDATFVDVFAASAGHDICAGDDAWVNGAQDQPGLAVVYHPFAEEQRAVADLVVDALDD